MIKKSSFIILFLSAISSNLIFVAIFQNVPFDQKNLYKQRQIPHSHGHGWPSFTNSRFPYSQSRTFKLLSYPIRVYILETWFGLSWYNESGGISNYLKNIFRFYFSGFTFYLAHEFFDALPVHLLKVIYGLKYLFWLWRASSKLKHYNFSTQHLRKSPGRLFYTEILFQISVFNFQFSALKVA